MKKQRGMIYFILILLVISFAPILLLEFYGESEKEKISPEITGISAWINSSPETLSKLRGKVVIVDFWTYSCINCLRTIPYLNGWYERYKGEGLEIVGVHSPEFLFEKEVNRVQSAVSELKIKYPVALDNDHKTWDAFGNHHWPHKYFIGADGNVRYEVVGEGRYEESEEKIRELLSERGIKAAGPLIPINGENVNFQKIKTPEIYFGTFRGGFLGNPQGILSDPDNEYKIPEHLEENSYYLSGHWSVKEELVLHIGKTSGEIRINYEARSVNWVAGSNHRGSRVEVKLDHHYLTPTQAGKDVVIDSEGKSYLFISEKKLYRIVEDQKGYGKHLLIIHVFEPDIESYTLTFG
ncbi:MAG: redoxin domain-containing protein [Nitrospirae bacterium]|nr:redoxin domain-containing protein [Nitrospirota bacterium]MBI3604841.1 redoxin domain-containing protein [Nitrospirota bacterium]